MSVYKTDAEIPALWQVGDVMLDEIEVKAKLGEGHLGARDLVYHRGFKVELAVTSVHADLFAGRKPELMREARFSRDSVRRWVQLGLHPHVVTCHYVREMGGVARIFAEYVEGGSLADWIRERKLYEGGHEVALGRMLDVAIQVAWGLSYAHEMGVPHQNVTPENVMLLEQPNSNPIAKLTDFGCPRAVTSDIYGWGLSVFSMFRGQNEWQEGVYAADVLAEVLKNGAQCANPNITPPIPTALADLLRDCSELADEPANKKAIGLVADQVIAIYEQEMGQPYARKQPEPIISCADNLNNRAISLAELGEMEEAMRLWQAAIKQNQQHIEAIYNLGVARWRRGELKDLQLIVKLSEAYSCFAEDWRHKYLLAQVHLERWDPERAIKLLEEAYEIAPDEAKIQAALDLARSKDYPTVHCLHTITDEEGNIGTVALSADGSRALSGSWGGTGGTLKLWDLSTGRCLRTLGTGSVDRVALSADGRIGLSCSDDDTIKVWDLAEGRCLHTLGHSYVYSVALAAGADGYLAFSSGGGTLKMWDLTTGRCLLTLEERATRVALSADGRLGLSGLRDGRVKVWDLAEGRCLRTLEGHTDYVSCVAFGASGRRALSGSHDYTVKVWDLASGRCLHTLGKHSLRVGSVAFFPSGRFVLSCSYDAWVKVWDLASNRCWRTFGMEYVHSVALATYGDGYLALSATDSWGLKAWTLPNFELAERDWGNRGWQLASLWSYERWAKGQEASTAWRRASSEHLKAGRFVLALNALQQARQEPPWAYAPANMEAWCSLYAISRKKRLRGASLTHTLKGHTKFVTSLALAADGNLLLSGSEDKTLRVWELASGRCLRTLEGHTDVVYSVALSPDGRLALSGSWDKTIKVWDLASGRCLHTLEGHKRPVNSVALSADGRWALSGARGCRLKLWDLQSGQCVRTIRAHRSFVKSVAFSADGRWALSGSSDRKLKVWDLALGSRLRTLKPARGHRITSLVFGSSGRRALSRSDDWIKRKRAGIDLWDLSTGRRLRTLAEHTESVYSMALEASEQFALESYYLGVKIWDLATGDLVKTLRTAHVKSVALSADGRWAIGGTARGTMVWALDWELEPFDPVDWDEGARVYLVNFLTLHTPFAGTLPPNREPTKEEVRLALTRRGKPTWSEEDFQRLLRQLQHAGYGWLRPEGVRAELMQMAKTWKKPPPL